MGHVANKITIDVFIQSFFNDFMYPKSENEQQVVEERVFQLLDRRYETDKLDHYLSEGSDDISQGLKIDLFKLNLNNV